MIKNLHGDRWNAAEHRESFRLNQRQRLAGVEVVHHDEFSARRGSRDHGGETPRRVKERHA
jgi:hypothetical protein